MADKKVPVELVKELRDRTGAGIMDCKKALLETDNDVEKAIEFLRKKGIAKAAKKASREAKEGIIESYIHFNGQLGVLVEVNCETDFVARTDDFKELAKNIAMHIAAMKPLYVSPEDVPAEIIEKEKNIYREQMKDSGKPDNIIEKILDGKINKYYSEVCLLEQEYVKDDKKKVKDLVKEYIAKLGENIVIKRFALFVLGE